MLNKINLLKFLIVVLFLSTIAIATETTWRHSGFEISGYDISGASTYNLTEIRKIEFGWNTSIPAVSETSRAVMYYDDNQKQIMQSLNGGAYQAIVDNTTVNAYTVNVANATGVLPNASIPLTAVNYSHARYKVILFTKDTADATGTQAITGVGFKPVGMSCVGVVGGAQVSWGYDDGTTRGTIVRIASGTFDFNNAASILFDEGGGVYYTGIAQSFDNDGVTIAWTKFSTKTGTASIRCEFFR